MNTAAHLRFKHMGLGGGADTAVSLSTLGANAIAPTMIAPSVAAMTGLSLTAAIPIVGAAIAAIGIGIELILHSGCGQTCIVTSQWANQAGAALDKNIAAWFAIPAPRPKSVQKLALANFQVIWNQLVQQCQQPGLGDAGKRCISDRQDGACKWKAAPPAWPGEPAAGECWNWWNAYYYPIANDPNVYDDSAPAPGNALTTMVSSATGGSGVNPLLLIGIVLAGAFIASTNL